MIFEELGQRYVPEAIHEPPHAFFSLISFAVGKGFAASHKEAYYHHPLVWMLLYSEMELRSIEQIERNRAENAS